MYRTTQRIRKAGVAALVAATALSGLASLAPPAGAITGGSTLAAVSSTSAGIGKTGQAAGNWTLTPAPATPPNSWASGEQVLITVDDNNAGDANCAGATDTLGFSSLPTVTNSGTAAFVATIESSGLCTALGVKNVLRLNFTGTGTGTFTISGVKYDVGAGVDGGAVKVVATDSDATVPDVTNASNAFLTKTLLTANNPPKGAARAAGSSYAISPIVIAEQTVDAADGDLCIMFNNDIATTPTPAPTVAVTGGTDTAVLTVDTAPGDADTILLNVTNSTPTSTSTFTISGINLETDVARHVTVKLRKGDCTGADLSVVTPAGYVGNVTRFAGSDRFVTAQTLFENGFTCPNSVVIARGDLFPDALAASYLAGNLSTGVLLTNSDSVPAATLNALRNQGVNNVYLVGGTSAISAAVATELDGTTAYTCTSPPTTPVPETPAATLTVQRIGGVDRYDTAKLIAEFPGLTNAGTLDLDPNVAGGNARTAIVASGENFPDALAGGPLAYRGDTGDEMPLLLTGQAAVPAATLGALGDLGIVNVVVLGGTAAVSDAAVAQLTAAGYNVRRIAGANRQDTAAKLAKAMNTEWGFSAPNVSLARGDNFPDALAGGPFAGANANPQAILLTGSATSLSSETGTSLADRTTVTNLNFFGGTAAVSAGVIQEALDAASQ